VAENERTEANVTTPTPSGLGGKKNYIHPSRIENDPEGSRKKKATRTDGGSRGPESRAQRGAGCVKKYAQKKKLSIPEPSEGDTQRPTRNETT